MKIKLDENLGASIANLFIGAGHDTLTVPEEGICSASDREIIEICRREKRVLVTLDRHFSNPVNFPPSHYAGIIVMRPVREVQLPDLVAVARTVIIGLSQRTISGRLWSVRKGRIREHREMGIEE